MKDERLYFNHILECISRISSYVTNGEENFLKDTKTQDSVIRNLEVIGEAVKRISENTRINNPDIQWKSIAGMRDKMIHDYFGVDLNLVWAVVMNELPKLEAKIKYLLKSN